ncbi:hypothetical protein [Streptomyces sp. NPDC005486]|uniref:hypothetical protein n=1 Tax=Streptomyces sp. NPDC005486 TaxID=3155345 RepID=UPI0033AEBEA1
MPYGAPGRYPAKCAQLPPWSVGQQPGHAEQDERGLGERQGQNIGQPMRVQVQVRELRRARAGVAGLVGPSSSTGW